ncbi:SURF1 family protein [Shewanella sp. GXUN23E]|uniref:SURF1 family protein n=1 Tax=Shewanella sp. GXUN23E TaxID=3422498 RepID=UPI003D7E188A
MIRIFFVLFTLGIFALMVKLGFWQLSRAEEKSQWQAELTSRMHDRALNFSELLVLSEQTDNPSGYRFALTAKALSAPLILLDNQVFDGKVGYLVYQLFEVTPDSPKLLVELGFIAAQQQRYQLPSPPAVQGEMFLQGKVYRKEVNPLSQQLFADTQSPMRIQNMHFAQLSEQLGYQVMPLVLQPDVLEGIELPRPWHPLPMSPEKHLGYALQWFSMAAALLLLSVLFVLRQRHRNSG